MKEFQSATLVRTQSRAPEMSRYSGMVWISGGTFRMGSDRHYAEEAPVHCVTVDGCWIDWNSFSAPNRVLPEAISGASMYKIAGSVVGPLMLPAIALAQQPTELNVGWLSYSAGTISQELSVRNNGLIPIKTVRIGCRFSHVFMHYSKQLGAGTVEIENIASNAIGYKTMTIASKISPTSATCHIVSVTRPSVQY
jgi:Sulfatase-modifying factor enzyme 1